MVIAYPHNQRFLLRRAHDVLVMKTCHALARQGHQVYLLMGRTAGDAEAIVRYYGLEPHPNLHLVQLPLLRRERWPRLSWHGVFNFFCLRALRRLQRQVGVDLVYLTELKLARFLLSRRPRLGIPFLYEVHGLYAPGYATADPAEEEVFHRCQALVTTTASLQEVMQRLYPQLPPLFRVPLASELSGAAAPFAPPAAGEPWRLCYAGQLYPLQGVDLLVRALPLLPANVVADIIGGQPEQIARLRRLAEQEGVAQRLVFHGFVPPAAVARLAEGAHFFVAPCRAEKKMPYVAHTKLYEYLAIGRPVAAADLPSVREEIEEGVTGALFRPDDPAALAQAVRRLMADPPQAAAMARNAREKARSHTWEARAQRLTACFGAVLEKEEGACASHL